jgi:hypothetical protein
MHRFLLRRRDFPPLCRIHTQPVSSQGADISLPSKKFSSYIHTFSDVTTRSFAELEDQLWKAVGSKAIDPILGKDLASLKWIDRRLELADADKLLKIKLRLPTLLHPSKSELKETVLNIAKDELFQWMTKQNLDLSLDVAVELVGSKPVPHMARFVENNEELVKQLGPGLVNVSQYLAVYR